MIWFDLVTPKSVLFFEPIIRKLQESEEVLITTRGGEGYKETIELLDLYNLKYTNIGNFGGSSLQDKFEASLDRQISFMKFLKEYNIKKLVCLSSVDACRVAFGVGIPIYNFYDIPLSDYRINFKRALPQARLTIPLATKMFKPFVVPDEVFMRFGLEDDQIINYQFIDPLIWLENFKPDYEYLKNIYSKYPKYDFSKKTIIIREEEYKSSYVSRKYPMLYEALPKINEKYDVNIVIIPRYDSEYLEAEFPFAVVLQEKVVIQHLLYFASIFIGGGGTINTEACFLGTPTISTRSFISHYDKWQMDNHLMDWVDCPDYLDKLVDKYLKLDKKLDLKLDMKVDIDYLVGEILGK